MFCEFGWPPSKLQKLSAREKLLMYAFADKKAKAQKQARAKRRK